jgi:hypothetical protein
MEPTMRHAARCATLVLALVLTPGALAGGPALGTAPELALADVSYVATRDGTETVLAKRSARGDVVRETSVPGAWGIPYVTIGGGVGGLSYDGRVLVLAQATHPNTLLRSRTEFVAVDTRKLTVSRTIRLRGDFGFDALSPNGRMLYLIENLASGDGTRYRVRVFDLASSKLLPGVIADRRQKGWLMNGYPAARATGRDGRWVFTLYANPNNYPFVHALDSVSRRAVCIGLPWEWNGNMEAISAATMELSQGDRRLTVTGAGGAGPRFVVDTKTFRLVQPEDASLSLSGRS